ncbi:MAG TPA: hypothetical protein DEH78_01910 [Solibacterales bacterium]|nr:hypothetical protein [Bryobacterales bacterium]
MTPEPVHPWRLATNERYRDVVKTLMTLSTASLLLPVFFAREFLGVDGKTPLKDIATQSLYWSWAMLSLAIFSGIVFHFLSAKWIRLAWGQEAHVFWVRVEDRFVDKALDVFFWGTVVGFIAGLASVLFFLFGYGAPRA